MPNANLDVMVTYNVFSVTTFLSLLTDIKKLKNKVWYQRQRVTLSISYLRSPEHLAFWILPHTYKQFIYDQIQFMKLNKFKSTEINQLSRLISLFDITESSRSSLTKKFKVFIDEHDRRRNTSLVISIPTLKEFYESCK